MAEDGGSFKIGISNSVVSRIVTLKSAGCNFDLEKSIIFESGEVRMKSVERTLHFLFEDYNLDFEKNFDGYTEWFDIRCFDAVVAHIGQIASLKSVDIKSVKATELRISPAKVAILEQNQNESIQQTELDAIQSSNAVIIDRLLTIQKTLPKSELSFIPGDDIESGSLQLSTKVTNKDAIIDLLNNSNLRHRNGRIWIFPSSSLSSDGDKISGTIKVADDLFDSVGGYSECVELCKTLKDFLNHFRTTS